MAIPPLCIWIDNQGVIDGWHKGRIWCTAAARPTANLWREILRILDDIGGGITLRKCKGHATDADMQAGRSTPFKQRGNSHADHYAGGGATIAEHAAPAEGKRAAYREARRWYAWLATLACDLPQDTTKRVAVVADDLPSSSSARLLPSRSATS